MTVRYAVARFFDADSIAPDATLADLLPNGVLAITIDLTVGKRYQDCGFERETLADCFTNYFVMSGARLICRLVADGKRARGIPQQLPADVVKDDDERVDKHVAITLWEVIPSRAEELLGLDNETILHRLYHEETVRLAHNEAIEFKCSCSRERSGNALTSLGHEDGVDLGYRTWRSYRNRLPVL